MTQIFDAVVIGAGAAGLLCAARAGQRGLKVLLIDHAATKFDAAGRLTDGPTRAVVKSLLDALAAWCRRLGSHPPGGRP